MFSRIAKQSFKLTQSSKFAFASSAQGGSLYTWGSKAAGLGTAVKSTSFGLGLPTPVPGFENNVAKIVMGRNHSALITTEGDLYTFGFCQHGVLGHGQRATARVSPTIVEYFQENNIKIRDVVIGESHTAAVTTNDQIYTWGFGGKTLPLTDLFYRSYGALGLGKKTTSYVPVLVEEWHGGKIAQITSGNNFIAVLTESGDLYNWGVGKYGVFADDIEKNLKTPTLNEAVHHLREEKGIKPTKIKACGDFILALFDNGSLYGWGYNDLGQLGVKKEMGVEYFKVIEHPTKIDDANLKGKKIVDFDCGEEISAILTDDGEVYWSGLKLVYQPQKADFPEGLKIKKIAIANPAILAITENNEIHASRRLFPEDIADINVHSWQIKNDRFDNGKVLSLGGAYETHYALVQK